MFPFVSVEVLLNYVTPLSDLCFSILEIFVNKSNIEMFIDYCQGKYSYRDRG